MDGAKWLVVSLIGGAGVLGCTRGGAVALDDAAVPADVPVEGVPPGGAAGAQGGASADAAGGGDVPTEAGPLDKTIVLGLVPADGEPLGGVASFVVKVQEKGGSRTQTFAH